MRNKQTVDEEPIFRVDEEAVDDSVAAEPIFLQQLNGNDDLSDEPALSQVVGEVDYSLKYPRASWLKSWGTVLGICLVAGIMSVLMTFATTLLSNSDGGVLSIVLFGPAIEEFAKILPVLIILEKNPNIFRSPIQLIICGVISGLSFATIENLLYINVYIDNPSAALIHWRWTVCTALHTCCCLLTAIGCARAWLKFQQTPFRYWIHEIKFYLFSAIAIHCVYNGLAVIFNSALSF